MRPETLTVSVAAAAALLLGGCSTVPVGGSNAPDPTTTATGQREAAPSLWKSARAALTRGDASSARLAAERLVLMDPRSARAHLLLGAAYHLAGDPTSLDHALTGYGAARHLAGDDFWAPMLAGLAAMERSESDRALEQFAAAALAEPDIAWPFEGLAAAAYVQGQLDLAEAAANRALSLAKDSVPAWRMAILSAAGAGRVDTVRTLLDQPPPTARESDRTWLQNRSKTLLRTASLDASNRSDAVLTAQSVEPPTAQSKSEGQRPFVHGNQVTVDVTLILADDRQTRAYGVNLLDGLTSAFSFGRSGSFSSANGGPYTGTTTLTRAINLPALTYNLNIFNRGNRFYEMLARPSLTAHLGQESTFFVGEQLAVQVSGVNTSSLEKLDVGVTLKINPSEIREDGATFKISADRSFFSDQGVGSFAQGIATFKQSVAATADVRFGQTLILSGLTESVTDSASSRVPVLGDIPGPDVLFSRQTQVKRERSVLVLVTPSKPQGVNRGSTGGQALQRLLTLWDTVLEPQSGLNALTQRLARSPRFSRAAQGDVQVRRLSEPELLQSMLTAIDGEASNDRPINQKVTWSAQ